MKIEGEYYTELRKENEVLNLSVQGGMGGGGGALVPSRFIRTMSGYRGTMLLLETSPCSINKMKSKKKTLFMGTE